MTYFPTTSIVQKVVESSSNSSTENLLAGGTFTGTADSTFGVNSIQVNVKADQNLTVSIQQSPDGSNWDVSDSRTYYYSRGGDSWTTQATGAFFRTVVTNLNASAGTTYFRLSSILCPIVEALPRSLNSYGRLKTSGGIIDEETGARVDVDSLGTLRTMTPCRLAGTAFSGTTKDTNFWTETVTGSGSVSQAGEVLLSTGTTANSTVRYDSVRTARKVPGATNQFRAVARLGTATQANNLRRAGCYDDNDGFFFQVNGTTFGVGSRKGGVDTIVNSGSFNGNYGASVTMDTSIRRLIIEHDHLSSKFFVDGVLLHTITGATTAMTNTLDLKIRFENVNSGGNSTDNTILVRFACIQRLGEYLTAPTYKHISTNTTTVCKYSAGILHRIVVIDNAGTLTAYDNTSATGTIIAAIDTGQIYGSIDFGLPFFTGLTIVTATGSKCTVVYE